MITSHSNTSLTANECAGRRVSVADRGAILAPCLALEDLIDVAASDRLPYALSFQPRSFSDLQL